MLLLLTSPMYLAAVKAFACKDIDETISICTNICFYCLYLIDVLARIYLHPLCMTPHRGVYLPQKWLCCGDPAWKFLLEKRGL